MNRASNRDIKQVTKDIFSSKKIVREDIYDILVTFESREDARKGLLDWVDKNSEKLSKIYPQFTPQQMAVRLTSDMDTYRIDWSDKKVFTFEKPKYKPRKAVKNIFNELSPDPELINQERILVTEIDEAKKMGDHKRVRELTDELIEVQNQQPEVGVKFQ